MLGAFLAQFYDDKPCPRLILLSHETEDCKLLAEALSIKSGHKVEISVPQRGEKRDLIEHALANAREALGRKLAEAASQQRLLTALASSFGLAQPPRRIEVYDNSHIQGTNAVGAMIVAGPEGLRKNQYRKFNIKSAELTPGDDFGMMREVLQRRFKRLLNEAPRPGAAARSSHRTQTAGRLPHCRVRTSAGGDGAEGTVAARSAAAEPGAEPRRRSATTSPGPTSSSSTAAQGSSTRRAKRWPSSALPMSRWSPSPRAPTATPAARPSTCRAGRRSSCRRAIPCSTSCERLRDEAHRFAIGSHRQRRSRDIREAGLQEIAGIGPTRKRALLRHFGTLKAIERASVADLREVPGVSDETARRIYDFFHDAAR